jgi:hypothetical protein
MFDNLINNLTKLGYKVSYFNTSLEAISYLDNEIDNNSVGFGGSMTLKEMGLYEILKKHNTVFWHQGIVDKEKSREIRLKANNASIYISSVNAIAETGEIVNIDATCNRVASIFYGHDKVYLVIGKNKIEKDYDSALNVLDLKHHVQKKLIVVMIAKVKIVFAEVYQYYGGNQCQAILKLF